MSKNIEIMDRLWDDNHSDEARRLMDEWLTDRAKGKQIVTHACGDPRKILGRRGYHVRRVANTGTSDFWEDVQNYDGVAGILVMAHFRCGGLAAKGAINRQELEIKEGTYANFVHKHVAHTDPPEHVMATASKISTLSHKPVLAVVEEHNTGEIFIQGSFPNSRQALYTGTPLDILMSDKKIQAGIYPQDGPCLDYDLVPDIFHPTLKDIESEASRLRAKYSNLAEIQAVNDPKIVWLTNNLKPPVTRFPQTFGIPNTVFVVSLQRSNLGVDSSSDLELSRRDIGEGLDQIHYPFSQCVINQNANNPSFTNAETLVVEAGNMAEALKLVDNAKSKEYVKEWRGLPGRNIIALVTNKGRLVGMNLCS